MSVNFYDLCRVCTANSEQKIHIFSDEGRRKNLNSKIAECLALNIEEKDRLPKVLCGQCLQHVESNIEFRDICKKSQVTLITWLNSAANNGPKVYIKDEISTSSGKSLSVLGSSTVSAPTSSVATTTAQLPMVTYTTPTLLQGNSDMLNSIVQVAGLQQQTIDLNQNADKQQIHQSFPQYTITVDKTLNRTTSQMQHQTQQQEKDTKTSALEEFLKLKPNIKVTPIRKETQKQQPQTSMQTQQQHIQTSQPQTQPQQITVQAQQITLPTQTHTALPQQFSQMQLQQFLQQQLQQQWQQQQIQQQLQQLTQFQPQQITITAPTTSQTSLAPSAAVTSNTSLNDSLSPSKSKKPKLNFVITPPSSNQSATMANTFQQFTGTNTTAPAVQTPQIQLQFQSNTQQPQPLAQQQHQTSANAANLLTNLAPLLQQSVNMSAPLSAANGAASLLSPNKCFLPITIKDENSDQQIVAHIDAKNFVFPTTYQLQMKLQPQIATVDGQPIMQLTPTSIPATLQLTPQALTNQTFQALLNTTSNNLQQPQILQQVQPQQQEQQQIQFSQPMPTSNNLQITSNQIIRSANNNDVSTSNTEQQENVKPKTQTLSTISQQKFKITQLHSNAYEITPANDFETATLKPPAVSTPVLQKMPPPKQQQQAQNQNQVPIPTSLPTQYGGITVQRISTATKSVAGAPSIQKSQEQQQISQANKTTLKIETAAPSTASSKANVWQKQNLTISRIPSQQQQQQQQQQQHAQSKVVTTSVKPLQQNQKLLVLPQSTSPTKVQTQQTTIHQQNQQTQLAEQQQQSTKKVVRRVVGKVAGATIKQEQPETAAIIKIESLPTISKQTLTLTTPTSTATTSTTRLAIKKDNTNAAPKPTPMAAENNNTGASTASTQGFECGQCHRVFKKKEHLTQHVKLHAGIRPFKCTQDGCDKDFSRKEHLLRHIVSHSGEKQFSCDVCEKPFSRKDNLNKHRRIHTSAQNTNNYTCEACNKSFVVKSHYEEHKAMHEKQVTETISQPKKPVAKPQQRTITIQQQPQQAQHHHQPQQIQFVQHQPQQQQTMHLQLPTVVTTQDLAGNTITITQSADPNKGVGNHDTTVLNLPSHLANFVQLGQTQFVNAATGQVVGHIKIDK